MVNFKSIQFAIFSAVIVFFSCNRNSGNLIKDVKYFDLTKKAELSLIVDEYDEAGKYYKKAFKKAENGYPDDYYNAFLVAVKNRDKGFFYYNARKLAELGMCPEFFTKFKEHFVDSIKYMTIISQSKSNGMNGSYRDELEQMLNDDQAVRYNWRENVEKMNEIDSLNFTKLKNLLDENGLPTANVIKIRCTENNLGIQPMPYEIPLLHFVKHRYSGIDTLLRKLLVNMVISPEQYAEYMALLIQSKNSYIPVPVFIMGNNYYTYKLSDAEKKEVDIARKKIGAHTIDDHIKIILEGRKKKSGNKGNYNFRLPVLIEVYPYSPKMDSITILLNVSNH